MLADDKKSIIKLLVALAWADGNVAEEELEVVEAMLDAFGANKEESEEIRQWAAVPRTLDDVDISTLSETDTELALYQGVLLTFIDGEQSPEELELLQRFIKKLSLSEDQAAPILESATARAKDLVSMLLT